MNVFRTTCKSISSTIYKLAPFAVAGMASACFQDRRIGRIVEGTILAGSGLCLSLKGTFHFRQERRVGMITRALGFGMIAIGVSQVASGIFELMDPQSNLNSCEDRIDYAKQAIQTCPYTNEIWASNLKVGPVTTVCQAIPEELGVMWRGDVAPREITVSQDLQNVVPKLMNAIISLLHFGKTKQILSKACQLKPDVFAQQMETCEWESILKTHKLSLRCAEEGFWPTNFVAYPEEFIGRKMGRSWDSLDYYLKIQEASGHTKLYRDNWHRNCDPIMPIFESR